MLKTGQTRGARAGSRDLSESAARRGDTRNAARLGAQGERQSSAFTARLARRGGSTRSRRRRTASPRTPSCPARWPRRCVSTPRRDSRSWGSSRASSTCRSPSPRGAGRSSRAPLAARSSNRGGPRSSASCGRWAFAAWPSNSARSKRARWRATWRARAPCQARAYTARHREAWGSATGAKGKRAPIEVFEECVALCDSGAILSWLWHA